MTRSKFSAEHRAAAVEASKGDDKLIVVALEFGVPLYSLRYWRRQQGLARLPNRPRYRRVLSPANSPENSNSSGQEKALSTSDGR